MLFNQGAFLLTLTSNVLTSPGIMAYTFGPKTTDFFTRRSPFGLANQNDESIINHFDAPMPDDTKKFQEEFHAFHSLEQVPLDYHNDIKDKIDVSIPYYDLQNEVAIQDEAGDELGVVCNIVPEMPMGREGGNICMAEAGRGMAIAGSVAAARQQTRGGKFYYLALQAKMTRRPYVGLGTSAAPGQASIVAKCIEMKKRSCSCEIILETDSSEDAWFLEVTYKVISLKTFRRLFQEAKKDDLKRMKEAQSKGYSPYMEFSGLTNPVLPHSSSKGDAINVTEEKRPETKVQSITCSTVLPKPIPEQCLGHFEKSPALPVAYTVAFLSDLMAQSISQLVGADDDFPFNPNPSLFHGPATPLAHYVAPSPGVSIGAEEPLSIVCEEFNLNAEELVFANSFEQNFICKAQYHRPELQSLISMVASKRWSAYPPTSLNISPRFEVTMMGTKGVGSEGKYGEGVFRSTSIIKLQQRTKTVRD